MSQQSGISDEVDVHNQESVEDLAALLLNQLKTNPQLGKSLLNRLKGFREVDADWINLLGDARRGPDASSSYKAIERFLEEGRRLKWIDTEVTAEALLEAYDKQRRLFRTLFIAAAILAVIILGLEGLLFFFDLHHHSEKSNERIQALHVHSISMTLSVIIGLPLSIVLYRLCPNTKFWTLNYAHAGLCAGVTVPFLVGLIDMVAYHGHFGLSHFVTLHGWMGILFTVMIVVQLISGMLFFRAKYRKEVLSPGDSRVHFHNFTGECLLLVALGTWISGITHASNLKQVRALESTILWNVIGLLSFILSIISFILIFQPVFRRRGRPVVEFIFTNPNASHESSKTVVSRHELLRGVKDKIQVPPKA